MLEAIVLVGGKGTRLKSISGDIPKPLVLVGGKPFVYWILQELQKQGFSKAILATGYRAEYFQSQVLEDNPIDIEILFSEEVEPLGTGGAIRNAMEMVVSDRFFVFNGDSFCDVSCSKVVDHSRKMDASLCIVGAQVSDVSRYGQIKLSATSKVISVLEKGGAGDGIINSGIYYLKKELLNNFSLDQKFSFEKEVLEKKISGFYSYVSNGYFIDIGLPEDYHSANCYFSK